MTKQKGSCALSVSGRGEGVEAQSPTTLNTEIYYFKSADTCS